MLRDREGVLGFVRFTLHIAARVERRSTRGAQNVSIAARATGRLLRSERRGFPLGPDDASFSIAPVP